MTGEGPGEQQVGWVIKQCRWTGVAAGPHAQAQSGWVKTGCSAGHLAEGVRRKEGRKAPER